MTAKSGDQLSPCHRKIVSIDRLRRIVADVRRVPLAACPPVPRIQGFEDSSDPGRQQPSNPQTVKSSNPRTIVQCHGCFDIVHPGHIRYLQFARSQGDVLIVSITGDAAIDKGDQRPYIPQELRAENLAALEFVDYVVIDPNATACALLKAIRPDVYVKGHEYATSKDAGFLAERQVVESYGGRVIFSSGQVVFSSSRLAEAMLPTDELAVQRLTTVCRRHGIDDGSLSVLLRDVRGKRILILGDVVVERYVLCDANSIASESPMMSLSELGRKDYPGGAAVVARQFAALGADPVLVTGMGKDRQSAWAMKKLTDAGVQVRALQHRPELATRTRFLVDDHKLFKVDRTTACPLDSVGEREAADMLVAQAAGGATGGLPASAAIIYDCGYGMVTPGLLQRLGATFRHRVPVIAGGSAGPQGNLAALRYFDLLCCSERRLRVAMNDFGAGLSTLAYQMLQRTQAKRMLVTLGKRGLVTFDRRSHDRQSAAWSDRLCSEYLPSLADRVVDRLGCGESVLTIAALALASGASFMQGAYLAASLAAIQIATLGLVPVGTDVLARWLGGRIELAGAEGYETPSIAGRRCTRGTATSVGRRPSRRVESRELSAVGNTVLSDG